MSPILIFLVPEELQVEAAPSPAGQIHGTEPC
jgi:hypothetical protein